MIEMTVAEWAREVGGDRHTWMKRISDVGVKPCGDAKGRASGAELYRVRDLVKVAIGGDYEAERLRKTREEADKLALQNERTRGELLPVSVARKVGQTVMVSIRNKILNMPLTDDEKDSLLKELLSLKKTDWEREAIDAAL